MNKNLDDEVALFIKRSRKRLGLTQEVFAEKFGCTKANVSAWENNLHEPSYKQLRRISSESGVPLPGAQLGMLIDRSGIDAGHLDIDQLEILEATLSIPKENRNQLKIIINTFKETDS